MARTNLIGCNKKEVVVELTQCTARFFQLIAMKAHYKLVAGFAPPRLPRLNHHLLNTVVGKQTVLQSVGLLQQKVVIIALQQQAIASHAVVSGIAEALTHLVNGEIGTANLVGLPDELVLQLMRKGAVFKGGFKAYFDARLVNAVNGGGEQLHLFKSRQKVFHFHKNLVQLMNGRSIRHTASGPEAGARSEEHTSELQSRPHL